MRISTKALFDLTSKTDEKNIKDILEKVLSDKSELPKSDLSKSSNKTDVKMLINNLLKELSNGTKTKENIVQEIKQSDISKLMKNTTSELKTLLNLIKSDKTLSKFAPTLEKLLLDVKEIKPETLKQDLAKSGTLMESKLTSSKTQTMPMPLKEALENLKKELVKANTKESSSIKSLDALLNSKKIDKSSIPVLQDFIKELKKEPDLLKQVTPLIKKLDTLVKQKTPSKQSSIKEVLVDIKQVLDKASKQKNTLHVKTIDKILDVPKADKGFVDDIKTLISNIKQSKNIAKPTVQVVAKLEEFIQKGELVNSKIKNNLQVTPKETSTVVTQTKETLYQLKELVSKKDTILDTKAQEITKLVEQTLKTPDFFPKELSKATVSEKLQQIVNIIKSELVKSDVKNSSNIEITKLTNKLESVIKEQIHTKQIIPNQKLQVEVPIKQELANDIKSTLLSIKHELSTQTITAARDISLHVDKLITQVEYFQLVSLSTNSQSTYLPFLWDGLEEGQVSLKKLKENRFFCEINLKLKEYGKIDLMLMLFDDIHLNISVFAEKEEFLNLVQENLPSLKQGINKIGLIPSTVHLKKTELKEESKNPMGLLGTGLNIEV